MVTERPTLTPTFAPLATRLPKALYFLSPGSLTTDSGAQPVQIWRLDPDGLTLTEITHENYDIKVFDLSLVTGRLAYVTDQGASNQLVLIQADGSGRQVIVDERLSEDGANWVDDPHWSPGGQTLAFSQRGLNFYQVGDGQIVKAFVSQVDKQDSLYHKAYSPKFWSPNGKFLLVVEGFYEGGAWRLYDVEAGALSELDSAYGYDEAAAWSPDSSRVFFTSSYLMGDGCRELVQFNLLTRIKTVAVPCLFSDEGYSNADRPWVTAAGDLLYLYNYAESKQVYIFGELPPWSLMRLPLDQTASPTRLRSDIPKEADEVLWERDGKLAIVNLNREGPGPLVLVPMDASQAIQLLPATGGNLRWGP